MNSCCGRAVSLRCQPPAPLQDAAVPQGLVLRGAEPLHYGSCVPCCSVCFTSYAGKDLSKAFRHDFLLWVQQSVHVTWILMRSLLDPKLQTLLFPKGRGWPFLQNKTIFPCELYQCGCCAALRVPFNTCDFSLWCCSIFFLASRHNAAVNLQIARWDTEG